MAGCPHTMKIGEPDGSVFCADCGKTLPYRIDDSGKLVRIRRIRPPEEPGA